MNCKRFLILTAISFLFICLICTSVSAAPALAIKDASDYPDPFSPNGDGIDDSVEFNASVSVNGFDTHLKKYKYKRLYLIWGVSIKDVKGRYVRRFFHLQRVYNNSDIEISQIWDGRKVGSHVVKDGKYFYKFNARIKKIRAEPKGGDVTVRTNSQLSVSVSPDSWNIGEIVPDSIITMEDTEKIRVLNDGEMNVTYSLHLTNPSGWQVSQSDVGPDTYILNAAFSEQLGNIFWKEENHALSTGPVICSETKFAGDETGVGVSPGEERTLWLQFKAPTATSVTIEQDIEVVVNAQVP
ncbi:hypothetical protein KKC91_11910 [bacterium]|nr:hypothetical protein [bacterium]MBU1852667.1 hypothetical protein [Candidatus Omnitrophota bacterium]